MSGHELRDHRIDFKCDVVTEEDLPPEPLTITVNPFVPSRYDADSYSGVGAFPTLTLASVLGHETYLVFREDRAEASCHVEELWPSARMVFEYYLQKNWEMFDKVVTTKFDLESVGQTSHQRTTVAYQSVAVATVKIVGQSGDRSAKLFSRFGRKHVAALQEMPYTTVIRTRGADAGQLEHDLFQVVEHFIGDYESWEMGRLVRFIDASAAGVLEELVLFRDEFPLVRDLYQQGFEMACKCLWILVAAQNGTKRKDANAFGDDHPATVPRAKQAKTLAQYDKLPNAYKIAYAAQVPGWECLSMFLNSGRRNTIGHATARHDLRSGRIITDKDPDGITYIDFLGETFGVFEALVVLMQVLRTTRVASSPDFFRKRTPPI
ncbi:hypothetical protein ACIQXM_14075 [Arthrobacter sp. NPDC097144]|uniref:hypothetical protein n=1 Tax=Arthrobacter sp. NPDC097144 TaxID=3363946 RepID=UPI0038106B14